MQGNTDAFDITHGCLEQGRNDHALQRASGPDRCYCPNQEAIVAVAKGEHDKKDEIGASSGKVRVIGWEATKTMIGIAQV